MSRDYAKTYIGIGNRLYAPGEELPALDDAQWKRLLALGAISSEHDPVEAAMEIDDEENAQTSAHSDVEEDEAAGEDNVPEDVTGEEEEPMPEIDVMDGIAEAETPKKKTGRKKAGA